MPMPSFLRTRFDDRKAVVKGGDRTEAIGRMKRALETFVIEGIAVIPLHRGFSPIRILLRGEFEPTSSRDCRTNGK